MATIAVVDSSLPTLLCSRPRRPEGVVEDAKPLRRRPAPPALELGGAADVRVKNTFVELPTTPPLSAAHRGRVPQTCPSQLAGRLQFALEAAAWAEEAPLPLPTPCCVETPYGGEHFSLAADVAIAAYSGAPYAPLYESYEPSWPVQSGTTGSSRVVLDLAAAIGPSTAIWSTPPPPSQPAFPSAAGAAAAPPPPSYAAPVLAEVAAVPPPPLAAPVFAEQAPPPPPPSGPAPGSTELPSVGSAGHAEGACRPCAFVHAGRCQNGAACTFCHLCDPEERKRRRREKLEQRRAAREQQRQQEGGEEDDEEDAGASVSA